MLGSEGPRWVRGLLSWRGIPVCPSAPHGSPLRTPLHCAASCNDTAVCVALVRHGAAIFATTSSDGSMAIEKCDPYREGYADCHSYLTGTGGSGGTGGDGRGASREGMRGRCGGWGGLALGGGDWCGVGAGRGQRAGYGCWVRVYGYWEGGTGGTQVLGGGMWGHGKGYGEGCRYGRGYHDGFRVGS